jgi:glycine/D-amino acid oxidase-like deaminating enzyme
VDQAVSDVGCDIVVIGAGIFGSLASYELALRGYSVVCVDAGGIGQEASSGNGGTCSVQNKPVALAAAALEAVELWQNLTSDLGERAGYVRTGGWRVAFTDEEVALLEELVTRQKEAGIPVEIVPQPRLQTEAPALGRGVIAASYCPLDGYANPLTATLAVASRAADAGVRFFEHTQVSELGFNRHWMVRALALSVQAERLILCTGAWVRALLEQLGCDAPVTTDINQLAITDRMLPVLPFVVTHAMGRLTLKQFANGTIMIGGGWQGSGSLLESKKEVNAANLFHNVGLAVQAVPAIGSAQLVRAWAGFEGVTPDSLPLLGAIDRHRGSYVLACARGGFTLAPSLVRRLVSSMEGAGVYDDVGRFDPFRFAGLMQ